MKKKLKTKMIHFLALALISSCTSQMPVYTEKDTVINKNNNEIKSKTAINGKADFPDTGFNLKADLAKLTVSSTVSIIYPASHPVKANQTIASGLTDTNGLFSINPDSNFAPAANETFILEATKRIGDSLDALMTIRTIIKWTVLGWQSITSPEIKINVSTTSLTLLSTLNPAVNPIEFIDKINSVTGEVSDVNTEITVQKVKEVSGLVYDVLAMNQDPVKYIGKEDNIYKIINKDNFNINKPVDINTMLYYTISGSNRLKVLDLDDGKTVDLMSSLENDIKSFEAGFTADRKKVIFLGSTRDLRSDIYSVNANGGGFEILTKSFANGNLNTLKNSPDRTKFVFTYNDNIWLYNYTANTLTNLTNSMPATSKNSVIWSPDSMKIVFSASASSRIDLFTIDLTNGNSIVKISDDSSSAFPIKIQNTGGQTRWSPNSARLIFSASMTVNNRSDVYTVNADGSALTSLTGSSGNLFNYLANPNPNPPIFSPDSKKVVYTSGPTNGYQSVLIKNLETDTTQTIITIFSPTFFRWAPDSEKVVFYGRTSQNSVNNFYIGYANNTPTGVIFPDAGHTMSQAFFSVNSDKIIYTMINQSVSPNRWNIYLTPLDNLNSKTNLTGDLTCVCQGADFVGWERPTEHDPTGQKIIFSFLGNFYWINTDGTDRRDLGIHSPSTRFWSKDGTRYIFSYEDDYNLWEMDMNGIKRQITTNSPDEIKINLQDNF